MNDVAIRIEGLGKRYEIGELVTGRLIASKIRRALTARLRHPSSGQPCDAAQNEFWALRDVNLHIRQDEVLGIIGRNGAGKSTLLKILSRITAPTTGRAEIYGRVASLLEVGTGMHPELTGRENVYLNGSILGMTRREIRSQFDEIVDFAGVEGFIDTPLKRYSSGMRVRLGFAVAAHLQPEILIVDEVLAVGDADFQKKCMGKMDAVAKAGRTVLLVSHNLDSILSLCNRVLVMSGGRNSAITTAEEGVRLYLSKNDAALVPLEKRERLQAQRRPPIFVGIQLIRNGAPTDAIPVGGSATFQIELRDHQDIDSSVCGLVIRDSSQQRVLALHTLYHAGLFLKGAASSRLVCNIPELPLIPGRYSVDLILAADHQIIEQVEAATGFDVIFSDYLGTGRLPRTGQGQFVVRCKWDYSVHE